MDSQSVYASGTLADLLNYGAEVHFDPTTSAALVRQLHLSIDHDHSATREVLERLDAATLNWPHERQHELIFVVRQIAAAEKARGAWNPKTLGAEYRRLAAVAMKSARLAKALSVGFSARTPAIQSLIVQLMNFTSVALEESSQLDFDIAGRVARQALADLRADVSTASVSNILLADLVVLSLGSLPGSRGETFSESTIRRRYLTSQKRRSKSPAFTEWQRGWSLLMEVAKLAPRPISSESESQCEDFRAAIRARLQKSDD